MDARPDEANAHAGLASATVIAKASQSRIRKAACCARVHGRASRFVPTGAPYRPPIFTPGPSQPLMNEAIRLRIHAAWVTPVRPSPSILIFDFQGLDG